MPRNVINLETAPHGVPVTDAAGTALITRTLDNGELLIGATGGAPLAATLTAGSNVTIVNGPGSVTINATGGTGPGFDAINIESITTSGTYTPPANLAFIVLEAIGGGGAGGGAAIDSTHRHSVGGGGGSGTYARVELSAAQVGASATVTIGAGGVGGTGTGGTGGTTSFVCTAGTFSCAGANGAARVQGASGATIGVNGSGSTNIFVGPWELEAKSAGGGAAFSYKPGGGSIQAQTGMGAGSYLGGGGTYAVFYQTFSGVLTHAGEAGLTPGSGGSGAFKASTTTVTQTANGGNGAAGIVIITEYLLP
jgi:hypothetical protein